MPQNMNQNHAITIDQEEVKIMMTEIKRPPKLLNKLAGGSSCCIFRVPRSLVEIKKEAYEPQIVSIGPYHFGNKDLEMIQEHKGRFLDDMLTRTGKSLDVFMNIIVSMDKQIRASYSESIDLGPNDLAKMMVLDGVFLIELFRKVGKLVSTHKDDPIFKMGWVSSFLVRDLLKIENQIPFCLLQNLFEESKDNNTRTLQSLILEFFNYAVDRQPTVLEKYKNLDGKHLLDIFRKSFINTKDKNSIYPEAVVGTNNLSYTVPRPATKLDVSGVKFKANNQADSFLDIEFHDGLLLIPQINMDDFYGSFFLNCVTFEQCYSDCSKHFTTYIVFMGCLLNTSSDVSLLSQNDIVVNYFGSDKDVAKFFKAVGKDIPFNIKNSYLKGVFRELDDYCRNGLLVRWAEFKHTYFGSPWVTVSAIAAFMLLSLAFVQTFYTVFPYYHSNGQK
ncbi:UPF0481 protein At3g47200-like isoform X1 [Bidens hawaiensis]|uniref:UPF0481 protein At3g47200-like isoform X1 n=1 Tax=Bidens hawaiensis TaxID=980011 RepID=UPI00404AF5D2